MSKSGYCVYYFAHRGIGRQIEKTDNMMKTKKKLKAGQPGNDIFHIVSDGDKNRAIKKYNKLLKKHRETEKKKREKRKKEKAKTKRKK